MFVALSDHFSPCMFLYLVGPLCSMCLSDGCLSVFAPLCVCFFLGSFLLVFAPPYVLSSLFARPRISHGAMRTHKRRATRGTKHRAYVRPLTRARARACARMRASACACPSTSLSLSERVRLFAGARPRSRLSRAARKDHQNSKLRGYIWGRFAASFWLGISKTPPLFEIFEKRAAGMLWEHEYEYGYEYEYEYEYERSC